MMNIAFVYDAVHPWVTGGGQTRVWEIARRLAEDHEVHWYGQKYWDGDEVIEREGVKLHGVCEPKDLYVGDRRSIVQAIHFTANLVPKILRSDHDVIDCQEFPYFPCFVSRLTGAKTGSELFVTWFEVWDNYWFDYLGRLGYCGQLVEQAVARLDANHVAISRLTKDELERIGAEVRHVSPLGIDYEEIASARPVDEDVNVLFAGRLIPEKNAVLFVDAVAELLKRNPETTAAILGEGPERQAVEGRVDEHDIGDQITVHDHVEYDRFLGYLKSTDVFAFPSQREGFGLVGLEALACGTPVVTSSHEQNAAKELVEDGRTGYICDLDATDLANKIEAAESLDAAVCRDRAKEYDWDSIAEDMAEHYKSAVSRN